MAGEGRAEPGRFKGKSGKAGKTHHFFLIFLKYFSPPGRTTGSRGFGKFLQKMAPTVVRFPGSPTLTPAKTR
jgi:hypothetical protein